MKDPDAGPPARAWRADPLVPILHRLVDQGLDLLAPPCERGRGMVAPQAWAAASRKIPAISSAGASSKQGNSRLILLAYTGAAAQAFTARPCRVRVRAGSGVATTRPARYC